MCKHVHCTCTCRCAYGFILPSLVIEIYTFQMELKFAHSHKALLLRKALQEDSSRDLFLQFLSIRNTSDGKLVTDVEFWLEVQRFKVIICHFVECGSIHVLKTYIYEYVHNVYMHFRAFRDSIEKTHNAALEVS